MMIPNTPSSNDQIWLHERLFGVKGVLDDTTGVKLRRSVTLLWEQEEICPLPLISGLTPFLTQPCRLDLGRCMLKDAKKMSDFLLQMSPFCKLN